MDVLEFPDAAAWESWLEARHADRTEAWLRIAKRHSGIALLKARTPEARARILTRAVARLAEQK